MPYKVVQNKQRLITCAQYKTVTLYRGKLYPTEQTCVFPLKSPQCIRPVLHVSSGFEPSGWQSQSQRSLSFVQLCVWALTRGRATRAMLMGTKWGVSPRWITEGEEKHVFSCIHVETWDPFSFLPFLSFFKSNKWKQPCLLFARTFN